MKCSSVVLVVVLIFAGVVDTADALAPVLLNVHAQQRAGTFGAGAIVNITYDVVDVDSDSVWVSVEVSADGGTTFDVLAETFTGDVDGVVPGAGKLIEWHAGVDVPDEYWSECQLRVLASDGETQVSLPGGAIMEIVWIEPGTFMMGSPSDEPGRQAVEGPQHEVTITQGFYLGEYEITQGQWVSVMGTTPWVGQSFVQEQPDNPATYISWNDVQAFIVALNAAEGDSVYRLPTEAEWEHACRAGTTTIWSFGDDDEQLQQYAWYVDNASNAGEAYPHTVGTKLPNPWGLYDMYGNVYEWVHDWYDPSYYGLSPAVDPLGPADTGGHVSRGGHFADVSGRTRSATRNNNSSAFFNHAVGARIVRYGPREVGAVFGFSDLFTLDTRSYGSELLRPEDGEELLYQSVTFVWRSIPGATQYRLQGGIVGTGGSKQVVVRNTTLTTTLQWGRSYRWRIRGENPEIQGPWSAVWEFSIIPEPSPTPVIAVSPDAVHFGLVGVGRSKTNTVSIRNDGLADLIISNVTTKTGAFDAVPSPLTLSYTETQEISVTFAPSSVGAFEDTLSFTTNDPGHPMVFIPLSGRGTSQPVLVSPADRYASEDSTVTFVWRSVLGATQYRLWTMDVVSGQVTRAVVTDTTFITALGWDRIYWWCVRGEDTYGQGPWSLLGTFAVIGPIPAAKSVALPEEYDLAQNHPNPFNPTTTISYSLPEPSYVRVTIYNALGQAVVPLVDTEQPAGYHIVRWDASGMAAGMYLCRMETGEYHAVRKMLLVR